MFSIVKEEELSLSNTGLTQLLQTTHAKGTPFRFRAKGFSMSPFIRDNDIITISPLSNFTTVFGRPVAFIYPGTEKLAIHRVIGKNGNRYLIKGDRIARVDGLIPKENIMGVVTKIERGGKKIVFGVGPERFIITFLSKEGFLHLIFLGWKLIRRILGYCLMWVQGLAIYRQVARNFKYRVKIEEEVLIPHDPNITSIIAKKGEDTIGFVQLLRHLEKGNPSFGYWLFGLKVMFPYRRMGVGEELTKSVIRKAKEENAKELSLVVYEDDNRAIRLYRKLGFEIRTLPGIEEKLEKEKIEYGRRRVIMVKTLD